MRISDWSSDVCSSDLRHLVRRRQRAGAGIEGAAARETIGALRHRLGLVRQAVVVGIGVVGAQQYRHRQREHLRGLPQSRRQAGERSEEHTSELQSLMRISYAVFCLKKKKQKQTRI